MCVSFRQEYISFRPYFFLIADIQGLIYFSITLLPLIFSQNKIYYKTIYYRISVTPKYDLQCSLRAFARVVLLSLWIRSAVSVNLMANALRTHGDYNTTPRRLRCELKNFCTG